MLWPKRKSRQWWKGVWGLVSSHWKLTFLPILLCLLWFIKGLKHFGLLTGVDTSKSHALSCFDSKHNQDVVVCYFCWHLQAGVQGAQMSELWEWAQLCPSTEMQDHLIVMEAHAASIIFCFVRSLQGLRCSGNPVNKSYCFPGLCCHRSQH